MLIELVLSPFQVVLLSATMPAEVLEVTKKFMREPICILVKKEELTLEGIKQFYINVEREVSKYKDYIGHTVSLHSRSHLDSGDLHSGPAAVHRKGCPVLHRGTQELMDAGVFRPNAAIVSKQQEVVHFLCESSSRRQAAPRFKYRWCQKKVHSGLW